MNIFYVYEHWRPDTDTCFWVGKGKKNRAYKFKRNQHYDRIVYKLSRLGMCVEVRMVESGLGEQEALALEKTRIAFWKSIGVKLANITDGGEGVCGLRHSEEYKQKMSTIWKGRPLTEEHKQKLKGRVLPEETRRKMSRYWTGRAKSEEHKQKMSANWKGRHHTEEAKLKMRAAKIGRHHTEEAKQNMRAAQVGRSHTEEAKQKMRMARFALLEKRKA